MEDYLIIGTIMYYGQVQWSCKKENVRKACEQMKNDLSGGRENTHIRVEAVNTKTGEIREYWNNGDNTIKF